MIQMFTNYEALTCELCGENFTGRRPAAGGDILCPQCIETDEIKPLLPGDVVPDGVISEILDGKGDDE